MSEQPFVRRVVLKNYKSIDACDVELRPVTFLVGPNGSGKSNFLDALRFVRDALRGSLDSAMRDRGGINEVRRRSGGHPTHFGVRLDFRLEGIADGHYAFLIGARPGGAFEVQREECEVNVSDGGWHHFRVEKGEVLSTERPAPAASADRLYLVNASGLKPFRLVYDSLSSMGFYNLNPDVIRDLQAPDAGVLLARDGVNLASVIGQLARVHPDRMELIQEYLSRVVPAVHEVRRREIGPRETIEFRQDVAGAKYPWRFLAANMSDGTLRALGILVALFQAGNGASIPLVGIEEPEAALHPAAAGILLDALRDAAAHTQVVVTSHSPDLLDSPEIATDQILAVIAPENVTRIGRLDEGSRHALRERLYTPGELLRLGQLVPDPQLFVGESGRQLDLFETRERL